MGRRDHSQEQFFYSFRLDEAVPDDHPARAIAAVLDLSWVYSELTPYYPKIGRPSIDPVLMIRMLIVGDVFAIRSERALCRDVRVNLAYRSFCRLSIEDQVPDHSAFSRTRNERFGNSGIFRRGRGIASYERQAAPTRATLQQAFGRFGRPQRAGAEKSLDPQSSEQIFPLLNFRDFANRDFPKSRI
jgi:transposase